ncbi:metallophosphoesterase [Erythrobacter sp. JK5]|uniref:metallophosphoesterase family protein n=1 Tax=Erythrobacter sp. JK5 TaxID=2829500 RepID=UPI001BAE20AF|nr:metallophosphoesterase [Erythrobacter sp. JK5]QUL37252.1 metallophosphoesterase [Erythrobacter sp. JK5]
MTTRLFHTSDIHFGIEDRAALARVAEAVERERPDAVICTGDLTQRAKHREYRAAAQWFASLGVPVWLDPGNHDMPYYSPWERFTDPYRRYRRLDDQVGAGFESDDVVLVPLKTTVRAQPRFPWSDGVVMRDALQRTLARLCELEGDPRTIIVTAHHPLLAPRDGGDNPTIGGDRAFAAIAGAGADIVMSGHIHRPIDEVRTRDGHSARMIGAGTLSTRLRHGEPPSYQVLTCERGGTVSVDLRRFGPAPVQKTQLRV